MRLEDQVCSLQLAKRLQSLATTQESAFAWYLRDNELIFAPWVRNDPHQPSVAAFTVAELGDMLPYEFKTAEGRWWLQMERYHDKSRVYYINTKSGTFLVDTYDVTEADARAKMLIYLIENGLLKTN